MVTTVRYTVKTTGQGDMQDVTDRVTSAVTESPLEDGIATVAVVGSTAAVTTIEFEPGAVADFNRLMEELAPHLGPPPRALGKLAFRKRAAGRDSVPVRHDGRLDGRQAL